VSRDTQASASRKSQIRALVVALVVGLVGTALAVSVVDQLTQRRRASKGHGRAVRRLRTAPAPGEARAGGGLASFSARIRARLSLPIRSITGNGRGGEKDGDESAGPAADSKDSNDSPDSGDSPDSAKSPVERARARRRPRPGPAPDAAEAPGHRAGTRRQLVRGNDQKPAAGAAPDPQPDARVGSHSR
jgi:hypothetical protein